MKKAWIMAIMTVCACVTGGCNRDETAFINYLKDFEAVAKQEDCSDAARAMRDWIKENGDAFKMEIRKVRNNSGDTEGARQVKTMAKDIPSRCDSHIGYLASTARFFELFKTAR